MNISDELIACYVEGTVTAKERNFVRKYLSNHPEEYERVLCLIDNDVVDYLGEQSEISNNYASINETSFANIAYSAAAFAPEQNNLFIPKHNYNSSKTNGLYDRLSKMSNELDDIL